MGFNLGKNWRPDQIINETVLHNWLFLNNNTVLTSSFSFKKRCLQKPGILKSISCVLSKRIFASLNNVKSVQIKNKKNQSM